MTKKQIEGQTDRLVRDEDSHNPKVRADEFNAGDVEM